MSRLESKEHRVASALLSLAIEENKLEEYLQALKSIEEDFKVEDFQNVLSSYQIPMEDLFSLVSKVYEDIPLKHLVPFLKFLISRRLVPSYQEIVKQFVILADQKLGIAEGIVYSASTLKKEEIEALEELFSKKLKKRVHLSSRIESSLLGGIRVFLEGKVYDGSISSKLENLREKLLSSPKSRRQ